MMGDHIASSLRACLKRGFDQPVIACQFAKLLKIACGHENTHAAASVLDLRLLLEWAKQDELPEALTECIAKAHTAREIALASSFDPRLLEMVFKRAESAVQRHAPGISPRFMVADFSGNCVSISR
jgi:cobalt-precorrin-5B (C1)-methyltransferase